MSRCARGTLLAIAAVAIGIVMAAAFVALGEISVRTLTDVGFQGTSQNLFTPARFNGRTIGNTPDVTARAFDVAVFTDHDGFRVPVPGYTYPEPEFERILILGDSVAFGTGVAEPETFVGLLRAANPRWAIYNSAVIGYHAGSYADVVRALLDRHGKFSRVILVYCLNDVSSASAVNLVERVRRVRFVSQLNDYLREHSKLYLYLKAISTDPGQRYFFADYAEYRNPTALAMLDNVETIATTLRQRQVPFTVIISPYEYQLRTNAKSPDAATGDVFLPQRVVTDVLTKRRIAYVDATAAFEKSGGAGKSELFLKFDPMHLSVAGHRVMYDVIRSVAVTHFEP